MTPEAVATPSISTPSELVAAREARGLSAADMQRQLKLHISQLEALERGEWDALPGLSFVRGILRAYARVLEVDIDPLLRTIGGHGASTDLHATSLSEPIRRAGIMGFDHGGSGNSWTWIALTLVALVAVSLFFGRAGEPVKTADGTSRAVSSAASSAIGQQSATVASHVAELALTQNAGVDELKVMVTPRFSADTSGAVVVVIPPVPVRVSMLADSWVEVEQVDGRPLLRGDQKAGTVSEFTAVGVLTVTSPYPPRFSLEYDGKSVPLSLQPGSQTLKVQLQ